VAEQFVELRDTMFAHNASAGGPLPWPAVPFSWDRSGTHRRVAVFTDTSLREAAKRDDCFRVAWLLESPHATRNEYRWLARNAHLFDRVLTFEQTLLEKLPHARFTPIGGCWLAERNWKVYRKTKNLSVIASQKRDMSGQKLRHKLIREYSSSFDAVLGRGYHELGSKIEGLADYRYSLVIENCRQNYYFTEKLIDCLLSGTIPIYWGCPSIGLFFDMEGIVAFEHAYELGSILEEIGPRDYAKRLRAVHKNFELAKRYVYPEIHVWDNIEDLCRAGAQGCCLRMWPRFPSTAGRGAGHGGDRLSAMIATVRATDWYQAYRHWRLRRKEARRLVSWEREGRPVPPPPVIKRRAIRALAEKYGLRVLVETGTHRGDTVEAVKGLFDRIYSVELDRNLFEYARDRFKSCEHIEIIHGDSGKELGRIVNSLKQPALFYLDGHYSGGDTARGEKDTPIFEELDHILMSPEAKHVILIDDARCFGSERGYPSLVELVQFVYARRSNVQISVENDGIIIVQGQADTTTRNH
jgi:hypothetical protein